MQKGQTQVLILAGIVILLAVAGGIFYLGRTTLPRQDSSGQAAPKPQPQNQSINSLKPSPQFNFITACKPEFGQDVSVFKVFIVSNGKVPYFVNQKNQVINQFKTISPFNENLNKIAFYTLEIPEEDKVECSPTASGHLGGSGIGCNDQKVNQYIAEKCVVRDVDSFIKILVTETEYGGSGGEVIVVGSSSTRELQTDLNLSHITAIHEVGHNMGLGDLYYGTEYFNGDPSRIIDKDLASQFPNTDKVGCPKWCKSYKPVTQYTTSTCSKISDEKVCRTHSRETDRTCKYDFTEVSFQTPVDPTPLCCVWDNQSFEYFGQCAPVRGMENIGIDCIEGTGCYFAAVYGNDAWRPVKDSKESIMLGSAEKFDAVSERWLRQVIEYCLSENKSEEAIEFRKSYANFIQKFKFFKQKIGYCGN